MGKVAKTVFYLYIVTVWFAVPYYNWMYAKEHGFVPWLFLGEVVSTGKGLVWPYFALRHESPSRQPSASTPSTDRERVAMTLKTAIDALNSSQQATNLINARPGVPLEDNPKIAEIVAFRRQALQTAQGVDTGVLNKVHPGFGTHFNKEFLAGLRTWIEAYERRSQDDLQRFRALDDAWADWYMANRQAIDEAVNAALK